MRAKAVIAAIESHWKYPHHQLSIFNAIFCHLAVCGDCLVPVPGMATENAFSLNIAQSALGFCGTVASWFIMPHVGRRKIYLIGQATMCFLLIIIGGLG